MKGYWVMTFRSIDDQSGVDRYAAAAQPVIRAFGGRVLAAGVPEHVHEAGLRERVAIVEFESVEAAEAAYNSPEYLSTVRYLEGAAVRDARIIGGPG
ncbi:DUF1330 domain-containing protein [Noviluteimonas gilva]|uniref:DUF1330 domain-containing protein n=1 Tax=Noviluteimonas gilva TaxID=2682097 RepID=A0A7C9LIK2_9GAMM|nr:DUF1330 domain-containing protein [Lysobacter gilvus]MUV15781.1 DUF1330 domain-containing protein [Lysobacter gilvus]